MNVADLGWCTVAVAIGPHKRNENCKNVWGRSHKGLKVFLTWQQLIRLHHFPHLPPHHRNAHPNILLPFLLSSSWLQPVPHCSTTPLRRPTTLAPLLASKSVVSPIDVFKLWLVLAVLDWTFDVTGWCDPRAYCSKVLTQHLHIDGEICHSIWTRVKNSLRASTDAVMLSCS